MVKYKFFGFKTNWVGKTVWEIVGNLKDYGVGRLLTRTTFSEFKEPSFYKIVKVDATLAPKPAHGVYRTTLVWVETFHRGHRLPQIEELSTGTDETDFILIPKDEEEIWYKKAAELKYEADPLPTHIAVPPVLKMILNEERKAKGLPVIEDWKVPAIHEETMISKAIRSHVKTPYELTVNNIIEIPASPELYANIEEFKSKFDIRTSPLLNPKARIDPRRKRQ